MAREFAKAFYASAAWRSTREAYAKSVGLLCEECKRKGLYNAGVIVHHKTHLTPENINDPSISLSWDNLELLCIDCHNKIHNAREANERFYFDDDGKIIERAPH